MSWRHKKGIKMKFIRYEEKENCDFFDVSREISRSSTYPILGESELIQQIKSQIEFAKVSNVPVFITGEDGTEKHSVARELTPEELTSKSQFNHIPANIKSISQYQLLIEKVLCKEIPSVLYLSDVDRVSSDHKDYLISTFNTERFRKWLAKKTNRLIISSEVNLVVGGQNYQFLAHNLGCDIPHLEISIPPLKERICDIRLHVAYLLNEVRYLKDLTFDESALRLFESYPWPGNVAELRRMILHVASVSNEPSISESNLLQLYDKLRGFEDVNLIAVLMNKQLSHLDRLHPALKKSLVYIANNYCYDISMTDLSKVSYSSISHLTSLFKKHLNTSFKTVLAELRIRHAIKAIEEEPAKKITDICLSCGFGDLSHFEKMFKRITGSTPRQFRKDVRNKENYKVAC